MISWMVAETAPQGPIPANYLLWGALITFIVGIVAGATPKLLKMFGEVGIAAQERLDRQRTAAKASDDADIAELKRSLANMSTMLDEERRLNASHRVLIADLYRYILAAQMDPNNLKESVPSPFPEMERG